MSETNSFMNDNIRHVARLFDNDMGDSELEIRLTPAQAVLIYWALYQVSNAIGGSVRSLIVNSEYPEALRSHAELSDWVADLRSRLVKHAHTHRVEVSVCG